MDKTTIGYFMWEHVNSWPDKPVKQIALNALPKKGLAMMLMQMSGTVIEKKDILGSFIGTWPFSMCVRIPGEDTDERLNAIQILHDFADWLQSAPFPALGPNRKAMKIAMVSLPSIDARWEDGSEDYQAVFGLQYRETRGK